MYGCILPHAICNSHMIPFSSSRMLPPPPLTLLRKRTRSTPHPPPRKEDRGRDRRRSTHQRSRNKMDAILASRAEDGGEAGRKERGNARRKASRGAGRRKRAPWAALCRAWGSVSWKDRAGTRAASNISAQTESREAAVAVLVQLVQFVLHRPSGAVPSAHC